MLVHAFSSGQLHLLRFGAEDRLHQPQRGTLFPLMALINGALDAGAHGAWLSGAGPTVCALVGGDNDSTVADAMTAFAAERVVEAFRAAADREGVSGRIVVTPVVDSGVEIIDES